MPAAAITKPLHAKARNTRPLDALALDVVANLTNLLTLTQER
jgi:hypothetical protein